LLLVAMVKFDLIVCKGGNIKRSLGVASSDLTIPKATGFEVATQSRAITYKFVLDNLLRY